MEAASKQVKFIRTISRLTCKINFSWNETGNMATALYIEKATNTVDLAHFQIYAYLHISEHSFNTRLHIH